jgi:sulfonate transport system substrate-binding protein
LGENRRLSGRRQIVRRRHAVLVILCLGLFAILARPAGAGETLKIRIGWATTPAQLTPILFKKRDILRHYGETYIVEPVFFRGSAPQITALAADELDIAALAHISFGTAIVNAHMSDLRIIADVFQDGVDDYYTTRYLVRRDGPIKTIEDLKGKVVASSGIGGAQDMGIRAMLRRHGLEDRRDYSVVEVQFPNMATSLAEGRVDLVGAIAPYDEEMLAAGSARKLFTLKDAVGVSQMILWCARAPFLQKNSAALDDFFEDMLRSLAWFLDPAHHAAAVAILAQFTKQPAEVFDRWVFTKRDYYRDLQGRPNLAALDENLKTEKALGFLKEDVNSSSYADLSFIEAAAKRVVASP